MAVRSFGAGRRSISDREHADQGVRCDDDWAVWAAGWAEGREGQRRVVEGAGGRWRGCLRGYSGGS